MWDGVENPTYGQHWAVSWYPSLYRYLLYPYSHRNVPGSAKINQHLCCLQQIINNQNLFFISVMFEVQTKFHSKIFRYLTKNWMQGFLDRNAIIVSNCFRNTQHFHAERSFVGYLSEFLCINENKIYFNTPPSLTSIRPSIMSVLYMKVLHSI